MKTLAAQKLQGSACDGFIGPPNTRSPLPPVDPLPQNTLKGFRCRPPSTRCGIAILYTNDSQHVVILVSSEMFVEVPPTPGVIYLRQKDHNPNGWSPS